MFPAGVEAIYTDDALAYPTAISDSAELPVMERKEADTFDARSDWQTGRRRTPRRSLIVVLPENHVVSADAVTGRMGDERDEDVDVILACAGTPNDIALLQLRVRDLRVLVAPAGTTGEDLRELAMEQAPGDIVTLLSGTPV